MLNFECADKIASGNIELLFTDSEGDEVVKICVSEQTARDIKKGIYKILRKSKEVSRFAELLGKLLEQAPSNNQAIPKGGEE